MKHPIPYLAATVALSALAAAATPAAAGDFAFAAEVDSCLAAVNRRIDLNDADRVRHLVTDSKRTASGYALTIETAVFSADGERHYAVRCLANGSREPLKLRIEDRRT